MHQPDIFLFCSIVYVYAGGVWPTTMEVSPYALNSGSKKASDFVMH